MTFEEDYKAFKQIANARAERISELYEFLSEKSLWGDFKKWKTIKTTGKNK